MRSALSDGRAPGRRQAVRPPHPPLRRCSPHQRRHPEHTERNSPGGARPPVRPSRQAERLLGPLRRLGGCISAKAGVLAGEVSASPLDLHRGARDARRPRPQMRVGRGSRRRRLRRGSLGALGHACDHVATGERDLSGVAPIVRRLLVRRRGRPVVRRQAVSSFHVRRRRRVPVYVSRTVALCAGPGVTPPTS
jgi:hypothetical protein